MFRTTFVLKETNEVITNPILIAKHFVIDSWRRCGADILGALPWDIFVFGNGNHSVTCSFIKINPTTSQSISFSFLFDLKSGHRQCVQ